MSITPTLPDIASRYEITAESSGPEVVGRCADVARHVSSFINVLCTSGAKRKGSVLRLDREKIAKLEQGDLSIVLGKLSHDIRFSDGTYHCNPVEDETVDAA
tara:strand:- start:601 stop:906 length:306 start_codon:yes stop_codon:yes gene_type:complete